MGAALVGLMNVGFIWGQAGRIKRSYPGVRPLVLILGAAALAVIALAFGPANVLSGVAVGTLGFALGYVDLCTQRLPSVLTALLGLQILVYSYFALSANALREAFVGAALWLLVLGIGKVTKTVGTGDVYLAPFLGFFAGSLALWALTAAVLVAGWQALLALGKGGRRIPFGPALIGGTFATWLVAG